ncbi:MAG: hypothetical protein WCC60_17445, partial [Ilumatobacteraceae bacterium]
MLWHGGTIDSEDHRDRRGAVLAARLRRNWPTVEHGLAQLYPADAGALAAALLETVSSFVGGRDEQLFLRDLCREADPCWFQGPDQVGYVCYTDLFAGTLHGVADRLDYLSDLGVTYLHLMPLLKP